MWWRHAIWVSNRNTISTHSRERNLYSTTPRRGQRQGRRSVPSTRALGSTHDGTRAPRPPGRDDPNTMTMVQFGNFVRGAELLGATLSASDVDRIFLRAVRVVPSGKEGGGAASDAVAAPNLMSSMGTAGVLGF